MDEVARSRRRRGAKLARTAIRSLSLASALAALVACSSPSSSPSSNPHPTSNAGINDTACEGYGAALAAWAARCGSVDPAQASASATRAVAACKARFGTAGVPDLTSTLNSCAGALPTVSCKESFEQIPDCNVAIAGTLATGSGCSTGLQCASGACAVDDTTGKACGTCVDAVADGAPCTGTSSCVPGDECTQNVDASGATCTKIVANGPGTKCESDIDCAFPNHCDVSNPNGVETLTCTAPMASGGLCTYNFDCDADLTCGGDFGSCGQPVAEGGSCDFTACAPGLVCKGAGKTSGTCVAVTYAAPGAACDGASVRCSRGGCNVEPPATSGTCPSIIDDGQPCDASDSTKSCDTYASCISGTCALSPPSCN